MPVMHIIYYCTQENMFVCDFFSLAWADYDYGYTFTAKVPGI